VSLKVPVERQIVKRYSLIVAMNSDKPAKKHRNSTVGQRANSSSNGALGFIPSINGMKSGKIFVFAACSYA
jgi:hypothetical protein